MNLLLFLLVALLLLAISLTAARLLGPARPATLSDLEVLLDCRIDRYAHLSRILGREDFDFLEGSRRRAPLAAQLRLQRLAAVSRYMAQIREEFESLLAIGSLFAAAPTAQAENFARQLSRQRMRFYRAFYGLRFRALGNYFFDWQMDVADLARELRLLRVNANRMLNAVQPSDLVALRNAVRRAA